MIGLFAIFIVFLGLFALGVTAKLLGRHQLKPWHRESLQPRENYRSLFEPDEEELRAEEHAAKMEQERLTDEEASPQCEARLAKFDEFRQTWAVSSTRANTIEMLYQASQLGDGKLYFSVCKEVLTAWRAGKIGDLSPDDLAQLLDSHFWLLPDSERTPGVSFRIREEIAGLRRGSEEGNK